MHKNNNFLNKKAFQRNYFLVQNKLSRIAKLIFIFYCFPNIQNLFFFKQEITPQII